MKQKYTVIEYVTVAREYYNIEAEVWEEAITTVMDNPERVPNHEYVQKGSDWDAEDQLPEEK